MRHITIIGGGLSGTLLAMNLIKATPDEHVSVKLVDKRGENDLGPAYSTTEDYLLNVPAGKMGAVSDGPEHFWDWLQNKKISCDKTDFLPRKLYRKYMHELFQNALSNKNSNISYERIKDEAVGINLINNHAQIILAGGKSITADKIVLALGNFPPRNPKLGNNEYIKSLHYIENPWNSTLINQAARDATVFFIGTGQTMVDLAVGLHKHGHKGRMIAVSRHGFLPMVHKIVDEYPSFYDKFENTGSIIDMLKIVRGEIQNAEKRGYDIRAVIDSLRPHTQVIWMKLKTDEKKRFIRHLFRYWEVVRSRIPEESNTIIDEMQSTGQLVIIGGRITDISVKEKSFEVRRDLRSKKTQIIKPVDLIVNCMGPELNYNRIQSELVKNLLERGLIQPDPVNLGINAMPDGRVIHKDGTASEIFFTIGLPLRGILWECLAVPEIREHARDLSQLLLNNLN